MRLLYLVAGLAGAALLPFFPLLMLDRGLDPAQIGLVLGATSLATVIVTPLWGHLADTRLGAVAVLRVSSLATALAAVALLFTGSDLVAVMPMAAVMYAFAAPGVPLSDALAVAYLGPARMKDYGRIRLWTSAGWTVAAIAFGALFERVGLELVLPAYALGILAFGLWTFALPPGMPSPTRAKSRLGAVGEAFRSSPRLAAFLGGMFLVSVATSAAWSFIGLRIVGQRGGLFLVGLAAGLSAVVEVPVMYYSSTLCGRFGLRAVYVAGILVYAAVCLSWALASNPVVSAAVAGVRGIAFALTYVGMVVIVGQLVPPRLLSTGQALAQTFGWNVAPIVGASLGGIVYDRLGAPLLFGGCAALCVVGAATVRLVLAGSVSARPH